MIRGKDAGSHLIAEGLARVAVFRLTWRGSKTRAGNRPGLVILPGPQRRDDSIDLQVSEAK
jgi:hypothetical protein